MMQFVFFAGSEHSVNMAQTPSMSDLAQMSSMSDLASVQDMSELDYQESYASFASAGYY